MINLLDTVPDKVLICSQKVEGQDLRPLYSNRQMRDFYGEDLVKSKLSAESADKRKSEAKSPAKSQDEQAKGINKAIFSPIQNDLFGGQAV